MGRCRCINADIKRYGYVYFPIDADGVFSSSASIKPRQKGENWALFSHIHWHEAASDPACLRPYGGERVIIYPIVLNINYAGRGYLIVCFVSASGRWWCCSFEHPAAGWNKMQILLPDRLYSDILEKLQIQNIASTSPPTSVMQMIAYLNF